VGLPAVRPRLPALSISARRLAALQKLQHKRDGRPQLLVTTINAVLQRTLTPFRIRESTRLLTPGVEIGRESLIALLQRQGYSRTDTVVDAGEYAVRGSVFDIYPTGLDHGLRLDFFGDELETLRLFDPTTQRSVQPVETHLLLPASEALLDETSIKRFRSRYREIFGANATSDALYQAVSEGRRLAGMEHWLPCSKSGWSRCSTIWAKAIWWCSMLPPPRPRKAGWTISRITTPPAPRRRPANRAPTAR
jgi:transcription-repair coupling factor (superfamily II helicase)